MYQLPRSHSAEAVVEPGPICLYKEICAQWERLASDSPATKHPAVPSTSEGQIPWKFWLSLAQDLRLLAAPLSDISNTLKHLHTAGPGAQRACILEVRVLGKMLAQHLSLVPQVYIFNLGYDFTRAWPSNSLLPLSLYPTG